MRKVFLTLALAAGALIGGAGSSAQSGRVDGHPTAVTDCRAGCQGGYTNCRECTQMAVITADPNHYLLTDSIRVVRRWDASDSPGINGTPHWVIRERYPDTNQPYRVTVIPDLNTCSGRDPHTQGVTFFELQMLQRRIR